MFDALIGSSSRVNKNLPPEVSPTTANFAPNKDDSELIKVFIEQTAWKEASQLSKDEIVQEICSFNILYQLRQLRSKFRHISTYIRCKGSSADFNNRIMQPCTIRTYFNFDSQAN